MLIIGKSDHEKEYPVKVGDDASIELFENPSTGYSWVVEVTDGIEVSESRFDSRSTLIGSGGDHRWSIRMVKPGRLKFSGIYKRPWENAKGNEKRFTVYFLVE